MKPDQIFTGTSGFHYNHWKGSFFPEDLPKEQWLSYYSQYFTTTEINNTFYSLPEDSTLKDWREKTPEGFLFSLKASRYITHQKKLKDTRTHVPRFWDSVQELGPRIGPILFQLPPNLHANPEKLKDFIASHPTNYTYALEFRHESWYGEEILSILEENNIPLVLHDFQDAPAPLRSTADTVYIRLHGPNGDYSGSYTNDQLKEWASVIQGFLNEDRKCFVYFNNDDSGYAPNNALELASLF